MQPLQLSSGDLVVDRRASYAQMLFEAGDHAAAADLMRDALALAGRWAAGWFRLGEMLEAAGMPAEAAGAWREALQIDPADRLGASLKLAAAGQAVAPPAPPPGFVEALFDQYADRFDASLVGRLGYRVPELLAAALALVHAGRFPHVVDLGCGTGLMAERLVGRADYVEGVDISSGMLKHARAKGFYDRLTQADLSAFDVPAGADLVTAADVFMYVGALDAVFGRVASALRPGALFAFSVEAHDGPGEIVLRPSRRWAHSEACLRRLLDANGLALLSLERDTIRMDRGAPIEGFVAVARRTHAAAHATGSRT